MKATATLLDLTNADPFIHSVRRGVAAALAQTDPERAVTFAQQYIELSDADDSLISKKLDPGLDLFRYSTGRLVERGRFESALSYIQAMPAKGTKGALLYRLVKEWGEVDPVSFERFSQGNSEVFLAEGIDSATMEEAMHKGYIKIRPQWVMAQEGGLQLFPAWIKHDTEQARAWLAQQPVSTTLDDARITAYRSLRGRGHFMERAGLLNSLAGEHSNLDFYQQQLETEWMQADSDGYEAWKTESGSSPIP